MRILIVDDDSSCRELLKGILSPYAECDMASDGSEALEAFRLALEEGHPYKVMFLDIMMPGVDGHETLDAIRHIESDYNIRGADSMHVIMTTAINDPTHCIRAFEEGCKCYIVKPFTPKRILEQMRALVGDMRQRPLPSRPKKIPQTSSGSGQKFAPSGHSRKKFLIVDDDGICRSLIEALISNFGDCTFAYNGHEAVEAVRLALEDHQPFDLITLDIMMPGMNGHDALKAIRNVEAEHGIGGSDGVKVIMTTALRDSKHCVQAFREGCECYVTKPVSDAALLGKMQELGVLEEAAVLQ